MNQDWQTKYLKIKGIYDTARQEIVLLRTKKRKTVEQIKKKHDLAKAQAIKEKIQSL